MKGVLFAFLVLIGTPLRAHEDTLFYVQTDGSVVGLPADYGPVHVLADFTTSQMCGVPPPTLAVAFRDTIVDVPACIMEHAREVLREDLFALGSWYHDSSMMPPYLSLHLSPSKSLLFNLETGALLLDHMSPWNGIDPFADCSSWETIHPSLDVVFEQCPVPNGSSGEAND